MESPSLGDGPDIAAGGRLGKEDIKKYAYVYLPGDGR